MWFLAAPAPGPWLLGKGVEAKPWPAHLLQNPTLTLPLPHEAVGTFPCLNYPPKYQCPETHSSLVFLSSSAPLLFRIKPMIQGDQPPEGCQASPQTPGSDLHKSRASGKQCISPFTKQVLENALNTLILGHVLIIFTSSYKPQFSCTLRMKTGALEPKEPCDDQPCVSA